MQGTHWCFTLNNPPPDFTLTLQPPARPGVGGGPGPPTISYATWQTEIAPETGTEHIQGYIQFEKRVRLTPLKELIPRAHWEVARGTPQQARDYCQKEETRKPNTEFSEIGTLREASKKRKRAELLEALQSGLTPKRYATDFIDTFIKNPNLIAQWETAQIEGRTGGEGTSCTVCYGPPGTGKSRYVSELTRGRGPYRKQPGKWWDGYRGERIVIFDDFRGSSLSFTDFKLTVDRYPFRVEIKGSYVDLAATEFYITTNYAPTDWWSKEVTGSHIEAINRRITKFLFFETAGKFREFHSFSHFQRCYLYGEISQELRETIPPLQEAQVEEVLQEEQALQ